MRLKSRFTSWAAMLVVTLTALLVLARTAFAATFYVVDDNADPATCNNLTHTHTTMQTAVNDAIANGVHTIQVCRGSHSQFVVIGANGLTIKAAVAGSFPTITAPASTFGNIVLVQPSLAGVPSKGVVIDGLHLNGTNFNDGLTGPTAGIHFLNSSGKVLNSSISGVRDAVSTQSHGYGIWVEDDNADGKSSAVTVTSNSITDVQYTMIHAEGAVKVTVSKTHMVGNFSGGGDPGVHGVAFWQGATGSVASSQITDVMFGVSIFGASKVKVTGNHISDVSTGVSIIANCNPGREAANNNKITSNTFSGVSSGGVFVAAGATPDTCSPHADNNVISNNRFGGTPSSNEGAEVAESDGVTNSASATKNSVTNNMFFKFTVDVDAATATSTTISGNTFFP